MPHLLEMKGISMAPWLMPGDVLLVDESISSENVRFGDVIVLRNRDTGFAMAHRIVGKGILTKGDRNRKSDPGPGDWKFEGVALRRNRNGKWRSLRFGRILGWFSLLGLYPGQRLPHWMSRSYFRKIVRA